MILKINSKLRYFIDKLLLLWRGKENDLIQAKKLREDSTYDEVTATF